MVHYTVINVKEPRSRRIFSPFFIFFVNLRDLDGLFWRSLLSTPRIGVFFSFDEDSPFVNGHYEKSHAEGKAHFHECVTLFHSLRDIVPVFIESFFFLYVYDKVKMEAFEMQPCLHSKKGPHSWGRP